MSNENVVKLPIAEQEKAPVANFTLVVSLPDGRQVSATTAYFDTPEGPDPLIDRLMDSLERQRARAEIKEFDAKIEEHEEAVAKGEADITALNEKTEKAISDLKNGLVTVGEEFDKEFNRLKTEHEKDGRSTFDAEKPGNKARLSVFPRRKVEIEAEIKKLTDERENGEKNFRSSMALFQMQIDKAKKLREARVKIVG